MDRWIKGDLKNNKEILKKKSLCLDLNFWKWKDLSLNYPMLCKYYGEDFTHGFDTQNYPKLQASLGTQPKNTHGIQRQTQPIPVDFFGLGQVILGTVSRNY